MTHRSLIASFAICATLVFASDEPSDKAVVQAATAAALKKEAEGDWKKIHWEKNSDEALTHARMGKKPLLIVIVVGERGQKKAAEC